jgi:hypothetical protein
MVSIHVTNLPGPTEAPDFYTRRQLARAITGDVFRRKVHKVVTLARSSIDVGYLHRIHPV